jgi:hypothetical protein
MNRRVGAWRSLVAHLNGVQGVDGSNPFAPTNFINQLDGGWFCHIDSCDRFVTVIHNTGGRSVQQVDRFSFVHLGQVGTAQRHRHGRMPMGYLLIFWRVKRFPPKVV